MDDPSELDLLRRLLAAMDLADRTQKHFPYSAKHSHPEDARVTKTAHEIADIELSDARYDFIHRMRIEKRPLEAWKDASSLQLGFLATREEAQAALDSQADAEKTPLRAPYEGELLFSKRHPF